jgi:hypothetical protein
MTGVQRNYLCPRFAPKLLDLVRRDDVNGIVAELIEKKLSLQTIKNAIAVIRCMFPGANASFIESLDVVPAATGSNQPKPSATPA